MATVYLINTKYPSYEASLSALFLVLSLLLKSIKIITIRTHDQEKIHSQTIWIKKT